MKELKSEIVSWLESENPVYMDGIQLASRALPNKQMVFFLAKKQTVNNFDKIKYELSKFVGLSHKPIEGVARATFKADQPQASQESESVEEIEFVVSDADRAILDTTILPQQPEGQEEAQETTDLRPQRNQMLQSLQEEVRNLFLQKDQFYNQRNMGSQAIQDLGENPDPEQLKTLTAEVLELDEAIKAIDSQIQYFYRNGTIAPKAEASTGADLTDDVKAQIETLKKSIANKRSEVSRQEKKVGKNPENVQYQEVLAKLKVELNELLFKRDSLKSVS
jgi:hypothetical protein